MQRVLSPLNVIFNADFQKISAEIPFTPSYLEAWHDKGSVYILNETNKTWQGLNFIHVMQVLTTPCMGSENRKWLTVTIF